MIFVIVFLILEVCIRMAYPMATLLIFAAAIVGVFIYALVKTALKNRGRPL